MANASSASVESVNILTVKVNRVQVISKEEGTDVVLHIDKPIKAFAQNESGVYEEVEVKKIQMFASRAIELAETDENCAFFISVEGDVYSQRTLGMMYFGAELRVEQTLHLKDEVVEGAKAPLERDKWFTDVTKFKLGAKAGAMIEKALGF